MVDFVPGPHCFGYYSLVSYSGIRQCDVMPSALFRASLAVWGLWWFCRHFRIFSHFREKCHWHFGRDGTEPVDGFGWSGRFNNVCYSSLLARKRHQLLSPKPGALLGPAVPSLVKFLLEYFTDFDAVVNGIVFFLFRVFHY